MTPAMMKAPEGFTIKFVEDVRNPVGKGRLIRGRLLAPDGKDMYFQWITDDNPDDEMWGIIWADVKKTYDDRQSTPLVEHDEGDHGPERETGDSGRAQNPSDG